MTTATLVTAAALALLIDQSASAMLGIAFPALAGAAALDGDDVAMVRTVSDALFWTSSLGDS